MSQAGGFQNVSEGGGVVQFTVDAATDTGSTTVTPNAGNVTVSADIVTQQGIPIRTQSPLLHKYNVEVQYADSNATALGTKSGMAHFNSAQFNVDNTTGFVSLIASTTLSITSVTHAASPYTVLSTDEFLAVQSSGGAITILLPNAPTTGRVIYIKDSNGAANTNNISVTTVGGVVTIDGSTTYTMNTNYGSINVIFDGSNYEVF